MCTVNRFVGVLVLLGFVLLESGPLGATTYYVSTSGNDSNSGTSTAAPWRTIRKAMATATAGCTVYIKAGLYQETTGINCAYSGTAANPIIYEGYKTTPGDKPTYPSYTPGDTLNPAEIPVLENTGGAGPTGIMAQLKSYITIRHIGVTKFTYNVWFYLSSYCNMDYVFSTKAGYSDVDGIGLFLRGSAQWGACDHCTITNCVSTDSAMVNIFVRVAHYTTVSNCRSYAVDGSSPAAATDYHICLADSHNDTVQNCQAYNLHDGPNDTTPGHGIGIKDQYNNGYPDGNSYGNAIINCAALDQGEYFYVAHQAYNNAFGNCWAIGDYANQNAWSEGINIRDGAHENWFGSCHVKGARISLTFQDTVEGPTTAQICYGNALYNCVFENSNRAIQLDNADNNYIKQSAFNNCGSWLFLYFPYARVNTGNTIRGTIVTNSSGAYSAGTSTIAFTYSDFYANNWSMPAGTGNIAQDPLYYDTTNYRLKSTAGRWNDATSSWVNDAVTSPCIDAGYIYDSYSEEPAPNGSRVNMGPDGNTWAASKTP